MSKEELNCCKCGKEFDFTERIYTSGDLWQCEDCAIKQMQENDNKDKTISDLEAKLAESEKKNFELIAKLNLKEHRPAFCTLADRECEVLGKLEEKQKEIEIVKNLKADEMALKVIQKGNQDKISFAVDELRRLKMTLYNGMVLPDISVFRVIDRQIEQLTHQHEDKGE